MEEMATLVVADGAMQGVKRCAKMRFLTGESDILASVSYTHLTLPTIVRG